MRDRRPMREKIREQIKGGAELVRLHLIPGGQDRRKTPRTSGPQQVQRRHDDPPPNTAA